MIDAVWLRNAWYVALCSHDLEPGGVAARIIMKEGLVFYRTGEGRVVALEDRCPHRYAPLSMGRVCGEDRIACPYHGLQFDATGACVHNPHGDGRIPRQAVVKAYPVEEKYGFVWVWMGAKDNVGPLPVIDFLEPQPGHRINRPDYLHMGTPWRLIIDNLLDLSHANFLHEGLLGGKEMIPAKSTLVQNGNAITVGRFSANVPPPEYSDLIYLADGKPVDKNHTVTWMPPSVILLDINVTSPGTRKEDGTGVLAAHLITPETETTSHYHFRAARWGLIERGEAEEQEIERRLAVARRKAFAEQDDPMMKAQLEVILRSGGKFNPVLLDIDAGVVRWQRIIDKMIADEANGATVAA